MSKSRIAGAIANKTGVTLYLEDGSIKELKAESFSTKKILDKIQPTLARGKIAEIDLDSYSAEKMIEEKTGGLIRFMKIAGDAVKSLFKAQGVNDNVTDGSYRVDVPMETTVAVVNGVQVPGMEKLERQIEHAAMTENVAGLQKFLERMAEMTKTRGHTAQELLNFIQKGDLPIADDGSIVAYKRLYRDKDGYYVDPHTRKVRQKVGSLVQMDEQDVDANRRTECSTGLHIGRRDYVRSFNGDVVTIAKIKPEDVIAVPMNEGSKMRTAAYHIVAEVNKAGFNLICGNHPITKDPESAKLLANIIKGNHVEVLEVVRVGKKGETKPTETVKETAEVIKLEDVTTKSVDEIATQTLSPKEINKRTDQIILDAAVSGEMAAAVEVTDAEVVEAFKASVEKPVKKTKATKTAKPADPKPPVAVHDREQLVIDLIKAGTSQREVERKTGVSARSVRRILDKHGLRSK